MLLWSRLHHHSMWRSSLLRPFHHLLRFSLFWLVAVSGTLHHRKLTSFPGFGAQQLGFDEQPVRAGPTSKIAAPFCRTFHATDCLLSVPLLLGA